MKKRIAIDMDEVIADAVEGLIRYYKEDTGIEVPRDVLYKNNKKLYQYVGDEKKVRGYLYEKGFFADLPVIENSKETVAWLHQHYEIFIVTASMEFRNSLEDKRDWMQKHFPMISWKNIVFCGDKSIIQADYMIDDHAFNLETFSGKGLLYTAPHNLNDNRFTRVDNWAEIKLFFEKELGI